MPASPVNMPAVAQCGPSYECAIQTLCMMLCCMILCFETDSLEW